MPKCMAAWLTAFSIVMLELLGDLFLGDYLGKMECTVLGVAMRKCKRSLCQPLCFGTDWW